MQTILSEKFGLYRVELHQHEEGDFGWHIIYLDDDGSTYGSESDGQPYTTAYHALKAGMLRLAELFQRDEAFEEAFELAGNGIRTRDILLGNFPLSVKSTDGEVQS